MKTSYRIAQKNDWELLATFRRKYSNESAEVAHKYFEQDFEEVSNKNEGPLFVATLNDQIVGYGRCGYFDPIVGRPIYGLLHEAPKGYYLKGVLTDESVRNQGVGKHLTQLRNDWVKSRADRIYCVLQDTNIRSVKMHEALGYKIIREKLNYQKTPNDQSGLLLEMIF